MSKHLWEIKHPYYCNDGNYFKNGEVYEHESWAEFMDEFSLDQTDMDYNLVFRWDWKKPDPSDFDVAGEYGDPEEVPTWDKLHLYFMGQRKGYFFVHIVDVTEGDEEPVREYLSAYAEHMRKIWEPFLDA